MIDLRDLLEHRLGVMLLTERAIERTLARLRRDASDEGLADAFERHLDETRAHVANVEDALRRLGGMAPVRLMDRTVEGLRLEHASFADAAEAVSFPGAADHQETNAYEGLIALAEGVGAREVLGVMAQNLAYERAILEQVDIIVRRLAARRGAEDLELALQDGLRRSEPQRSPQAQGQGAAR